MPLEEYLLKHNPEDPAVLEYFEYRCASVWSAVGKLMIEQEPDVALQYQTYEETCHIYWTIYHKKFKFLSITNTFE